MFGLLFGGRRRSPGFFYLRLGMIAALLIATFVLHASASELVDLRIARIALIVLFLGGARFAGVGRMLPWQRRRQPQFDAAGESSGGDSPEDRI